MTQKTNKIIVLIGVILVFILIIFGLQINFEKSQTKLPVFISEPQIKECESLLNTIHRYDDKEFFPDWVMCKVEGNKVLEIPYGELFKGIKSNEPKARQKVILSLNLPKMFKRGLITVTDIHGNVKEGNFISPINKFHLCFIISPRPYENEWLFLPQEIMLINSYQFPCEKYSQPPYSLFVCTKELTANSIVPISIAMTIPTKDDLLSSEYNADKDEQNRVFFGTKIFISTKEIENSELTIPFFLQNSYTFFTPFYRFRIPIHLNNIGAINF